MRIISWNCNMALHRKFPALLAWRPDIAVVGECAEPRIVRAKMADGGPRCDHVWVGTNPHKGLGVFAFGGYRLRLTDDHDPSLHYIAPVEVSGPRSFNLLAVWAQNANENQRRRDIPGPLRDALDRYRGFLTERPAVVTGDTNNNVIWDKPGWPMNWQATVEVLAGLGLVSAYHHVTGEAQGAETTPTLYWRDRSRHGPTYHIDYTFLPQPWLAHLANFAVGDFDEWCGSGLSDHVPLIVDLEFR